ncbi:MAG: tRNA (uridine(54)-C5)-methyltransferase TrmA [Neisseria sp.]|uniref:tRNA (uridine(54)-C5)-methyltransferase TrmA n=1 Tax=Neisseria sp. TaxID=192066 RepID=UPI0026DCF15E|nr:tRNA (uridine(54)-C5)-methyltransferase TrmA [Neisseria sp.]MDO4640222.1 tRNA (uridine(54)-C5)-methyltransferase TrmA [Neisseria sp.]
MPSPNYSAQLAEKVAYLKNLFADLNPPELEILPSPEKHYRMRAEFRIWHEGEQLCYAMFEPGKKAGTASLIKLENFPPAARPINDLMPLLLQQIQAEPVLKNRLYQCEFLNTLSGDMLVSLIYHKKLDESWRSAAESLQQKLGIFIIGRSRGQKIVLTQDFVTERLIIGQQTFVYRQIEGSFTQPNAVVCGKMLEWACSAAQGLDGDLLELYCGNGNFTLPLSHHFHRVLATEVSKTSVNAAQWNIQANQRNNIDIIRLSAEEFTEAYRGSREFRRLKEQSIELKNYRFSTIFIDPPRAGVDNKTLDLVASFDNIIYISCNPATLHQNLLKLQKTHQIARFALFDQFPFTNHIESGMLLKKR